MKIVSNSNSNIKAAIDKQAATSPAKYGEFKNQADDVNIIVKDFESYMNNLTQELITKAGGLDPKHSDGRPIKYKDKDYS